MSHNAFSTKAGALDGLELGAPLGGDGQGGLSTSQVGHGVNTTSSGATTSSSVPHSASTHTPSSGLTGSSATNTANTEAGVLAGMGVGHHNQSSTLHDAPHGTPIADKYTSSNANSAAGAMGLGAAGIAAAPAGHHTHHHHHAQGTHTGPIGGTTGQSGGGLQSVDDRNIAVPSNLGSSTHGGGIPSSTFSGKGAGIGLAAAGAGAGLSAGAMGAEHSHAYKQGENIASSDTTAAKGGLLPPAPTGDAVHGAGYQEGKAIGAADSTGVKGGLTGAGAGATAAGVGAGTAYAAAQGDSSATQKLKDEINAHKDSTSSGPADRESSGPHGLVLKDGKYVHQRELDLKGSTGVPLTKQLFESK